MNKVRYKRVVDSNDLQQKILNVVTSDEIDKYFNNTIFVNESDSQKYKQAMIHGMIVAGMLVCQCEQIYIEEKSNENKYY